jgi:hypothetical protein
MTHLLARLALGTLLLTSIACESAEDRIAGRYVRTWKEGARPERGLRGEIDEHVLILAADRTWTSEHPDTSLQQFDVPFGRGTWYLEGVTLTLRPTELGAMQYTVAGDTLFPRTPTTARQAEAMTGFSMKIGVDTYLLRER